VTWEGRWCGIGGGEWCGILRISVGRKDIDRGVRKTLLRPEWDDVLLMGEGELSSASRGFSALKMDSEERRTGEL
jgi:hypothetical protein